MVEDCIQRTHGARCEVIVHDRMQQGYRYVLTEPVGGFSHAQFLPELAPREMLELGLFGGKYMTDCRAEFPEDWLTNAQLSRSGRDAALNFFSVHAARSLAYWQDKGWIHSDDPRGRFQWYCRYYMGRRSLDDERQIRRRQAMTRHIAQIQEELRTRRS